MVSYLLSKKNTKNRNDRNDLSDLLGAHNLGDPHVVGWVGIVEQNGQIINAALV